MLPVMRCLAVVGLLVALALPAVLLALVPQAEAQVGQLGDYEVYVADNTVYIDVRPGADGIGCTELTITNTGIYRITVEVKILVGNGVEGNGSESVSLNPQTSVTNPICFLAETGSMSRVVNVNIWGNLTHVMEVPVPPDTRSEDTSLAVLVQAYARLRLETLEKHRGMAVGENRTFRLTVTNEGNADDQYTVNLTGVPGGWEVFAPTNLTVAWGEQRELNVSVKPGSEGAAALDVKLCSTMPGSQECRSLQLTVKAEDDSGLPGAGSAGLLAVALVAAARRRRR